MPTKLYVGNLSFNTTENDLQDLFATVGPVTEVLLMQDRVTGKSRGFGFVTMSTEQRRGERHQPVPWQNRRGPRPDRQRSPSA